MAPNNRSFGDDLAMVEDVAFALDEMEMAALSAVDAAQQIAADLGESSDEFAQAIMGIGRNMAKAWFAALESLPEDRRRQLRDVLGITGPAEKEGDDE